MEKPLLEAGFGILDVHDSTDQSPNRLETGTADTRRSSPVPVTGRILFGDDRSQVVASQVRGSRERGIRTVGFICEA